MEAVFYLTFYSEPNTATGAGSFTAVRQAVYIARLTTPWEEMEEYLAYWADQLEPMYGQIDWASGRSGAGFKTFGCNCFIPADKHNLLMEKWRQIVQDAEPQCVLGPVCNVSARPSATQEMLEKTYQVFEHQQSEFLRETLNEHVASVHNEQLRCAHKKM